MQAEIVGLEDGEVQFLRDAQNFVFPLSQLSEEDQKFARQWQEVQLAKEAERAAWRAVHGQFEGKLRQIRGRRAEELDISALEEKDFLVFYYSASWCGPCVQFTPTLINFYNRLTREFPNVEFILIPSDRSSEEAIRYHQSSRMPWPMLNHADRRNPPIVRDNATRGIPGLVLVNGKGEVLATTGRTNRNQVMATIRSTLEEHHREGS